MTIKNDLELRLPELFKNFKEKGLWLKSDWYFIPETWGCIAFTDEFAQKKIGKIEPIFAIYAIKGKNAEKKIRGKFLGFVELSNEIGHTRNFISHERWQENKIDIEEGKWSYSVKVKRAWRIVEDDLKDVEDIFPNTYDSKSGQTIGRRGRKVKEEDFINIENLRVREVAVYGQDLPPVESEILTITQALAKPSKAGPINKGNYSVGEIDGPRHLYILKLEGSPADWLGYDCQDKIIIKVGFSKSPHARCVSIQSNYPKGQFKWGVMFPKQFNNPPAPDGNTAKIGEDAMKKFLKDNAEPLDGEFYLVPKNLCKPCFDAGLSAITYPKTKK